ncbi:hypothetical protein GCM10022240_11340 [Microbacterium kribbense]|uniref:Fe-S cluster assembly protein HesB n=1 Tax=Microbacterium kribbense TaxID=433645 RepID=A0ABP7GAB0_9MICO
MFTITDDASLIIKAIALRTGGGRAAGGVRIYDGSSRGTDLALEPADGPEDGDTVFTYLGARVFIAPEVADTVDAIMLDAGVNDDGVVDFVLGSAGGTRPEGMTGVRGTSRTAG